MLILKDNLCGELMLGSPMNPRLKKVLNFQITRGNIWGCGLYLTKVTYQDVI